jgi:hypothetical protein
MRRRSLWLGVIALLLIWGGWRWLTKPRGGALNDEKARRILTTHFWVDRIPPGPKDRFHLLMIFRFRQYQLGAVQWRTAWEGCWRSFEWRFKEGDERLHIRFPQTDETLALEWKVEPYRERGFHYRLTLRGFKDYPQHWYTRRSWRIRESPTAVEKQLREEWKRQR